MFSKGSWKSRERYERIISSSPVRKSGAVCDLSSCKERYLSETSFQSESWEMLETMIKTSEEFYQSLELPYRIVSIVSGALNDAAAMKYDLEAWFPSYSAYRELVSCSNCTDYQSRELNIKFGYPKLMEREKQFVHMLNGTLTASTR